MFRKSSDVPPWPGPRRSSLLLLPSRWSAFRLPRGGDLLRSRLLACLRSLRSADLLLLRRGPRERGRERERERGIYRPHALKSLGFREREPETQFRRAGSCRDFLCRECYAGFHDFRLRHAGLKRLCASAPGSDAWRGRVSSSCRPGRRRRTKGPCPPRAHPCTVSPLQGETPLQFVAERHSRAGRETAAGPAEEGASAEEHPAMGQR